jgi:DNA-binding PadR family transcriptional regulator
MIKKPPEAFLPLKSNWLHILLSLVGAEQHGYGIMQDVLERSDGKVRLWPATLYGSLKRLIQEGLIVESGDRPAPEFDDARRRYYKLTAKGKGMLKTRQSTWLDFVNAVRRITEAEHA